MGLWYSWCVHLTENQKDQVRFLEGALFNPHPLINVRFYEKSQSIVFYRASFNPNYALEHRSEA